MAADSGQTTDKLDTLDTSKLDGVSRLANDAANLEREIANAEQLLKDKKVALRKITDEQLPEILEAMGLQKFTLTDGSEISVNPLYTASIPVSGFCLLMRLTRLRSQPVGKGRALNFEGVAQGASRSG